MGITEKQRIVAIVVALITGVVCVTYVFIFGEFWGAKLIGLLMSLPVFGVAYLIWKRKGKFEALGGKG